MRRFAVAALASALFPLAALAADAGSATVGDLTVTGGFVRAMLPNQPVGGGYLTIRNTGAADDRLVSVATPRAGGGEMHEMAMQGTVMRMRALPEGIALPAGATVVLKPGGLHVMFTRVGTPFRTGETVPVTLGFEKAGKLEIVLPVLPAGAMPAAHAMHDMGAMPEGHAMPAAQP